MNIKFVEKLPDSDEIKNEIPVSKELANVKAKRDKEIRDIFENKDDRFLLIIGPCSADSEEPVLEYVERIAEVQEKVKDSLIIIPRIYTNKPRTNGEGYKGMMVQPDPSKKPNILEGVRSIRKLHIKAVERTHMVCADEMLYPENYTYLDDILGYIAVGARSVENQQHRLTASGVDIPVGMKNPTSGDISVMLNSINAAQIKHTFMYNGWQVETKGNSLCHAVLRGAVDSYGRNIPNYHYENLIELSEKYKKMNLLNPAVIIDTNHANSMKKFDEQPRIAREVLFSRKYNSRIRKLVKGIMVESYIVEGRQKIGDNIYGKSITDACLGWKDTEKLIYYIAENAN